MKVKYVVMQTGNRTWQVGQFVTLDNTFGFCPMFEVRKERFHSEYEALKSARELQSGYDAADCKVLHDLVIVPGECTPKRNCGKALVELATAGKL